MERSHHDYVYVLSTRTGPASYVPSLRIHFYR